jgi:hypothetical protein
MPLHVGQVGRQVETGTILGSEDTEQCQEPIYLDAKTYKLSLSKDFPLQIFIRYLRIKWRSKKHVRPFFNCMPIRYEQDSGFSLGHATDQS